MTKRREWRCYQCDRERPCVFYYDDALIGVPIRCPVNVETQQKWIRVTPSKEKPRGEVKKPRRKRISRLVLKYMRRKGVRGRPVSIVEVRDAVGRTHRETNNCLCRLVRDGKIKRVGQGTYQWGGLK